MSTYFALMVGVQIFEHFRGADRNIARGLYLNMHGEPSRGIDGIEWEGIAERVAMHPPYFLLFDSRFIEVRHMVTGQLHQIIPGSDIHCIWNDRRCITDMDINDPDNVSRDGRVHAVMMSTDPPTAPRTVAQQNSSKQIVFELVLTET